MDTAKTEQLAALWTASQRQVASYIATLVGNHHTAEEILQKVAVVLVRKFDDYDPAQPFTGWAIGVAKFEVLAWRRSVATERHVFDDGLVDKITDSYQRIPTRTSSTRDALEECIAQLEGRARQAIAMRYTDELSTAELAKELKTSEGAVRMLLMRTRESLRQCIEQRVASGGAKGGQR